MGCGKSSVGKILATLLPECRLIDLDTYIEEKQGKIFPKYSMNMVKRLFAGWSVRPLRRYSVTSPVPAPSFPSAAAP